MAPRKTKTEDGGGVVCEKTKNEAFKRFERRFCVQKEEGSLHTFFADVHEDRSVVGGTSHGQHHRLLNDECHFACVVWKRKPSSIMELRASAQCSATSKACLVAGRYASVTLKEVVDETAAEVLLQLGSAPSDGDVKGTDAVLR